MSYNNLMKIKTVQWNIGGAETGLENIISTLKHVNPDIITFQEIHEGKVSQTKEISKALGLPHFVVDSYGSSHIDKRSKLSQSILSRFPLSNHRFQLFINPGYQIIIEGKPYPCHDKGVTKVVAALEDKMINIQTLHMVPFAKASVDPLGPLASELREDICRKIEPLLENYLLQGDFNFDNESLRPFLPTIFRNGVKEVLQTGFTGPLCFKSDHIIYRGLTLVKSNVFNKIQTDHFPIITEFEI